MVSPISNQSMTIISIKQAVEAVESKKLNSIDVQTLSEIEKALWALVDRNKDVWQSEPDWN